MGLKLARDQRQSVLQVGSYKTSDYQNIESTGVSDTFVYDTVVRIQAVEGDCWISRATGTATPADEVGLFLPDGGEITMELFIGETVGVYGGTINIVPLTK